MCAERRIRAALVWVALVAATGCASATGASTGTDDVDAREQSAMLAHGEQVLISRCMREAGYEYEVEEPTEERRSDDQGSDDQYRFAYGIDDVAWAAEHGFGDAADSDHPPPASGDERADDGLSGEAEAEYMEALFGGGPREVSVPLPDGMVVSANSDGCAARAEAELYGDFRTWFELDVTIRHLDSEVYRRVVADERFSAVTEVWSECMRAAGIPADDPNDLRERFVGRAEAWPEDRARSVQREWAVAEATCVVDSELTTTASTFERRYEAQVRDEHRGEIEQLEGIETRALDRARALATS